MTQSCVNAFARVTRSIVFRGGRLRVGGVIAPRSGLDW